MTLLGVAGSESTILFGRGQPGLMADGGHIDLEGFTVRGVSVGNSAAGLHMTGTSGAFTDIQVSELSGGALIYVPGGDTVWERILVENNEVADFPGIAVGNQGSADTVVMRHLIVRHNEVNQILTVGNLQSVVISNSIFHDNTFREEAFTIHTPGILDFTNNVVFRNETTTGGSSTSVFGLSGSSPGVFRNNIVAENDVSTGDPYGRLGTISGSYNDTWPSGTLSGSGNLNINPHFTEAAGGDFTLDPSLSGCIDAGDPSAAWNDVDGSRGDMGAFGGPNGAW